MIGNGRLFGRFHAGFLGILQHGASDLALAHHDDVGAMVLEVLHLCVEMGCFGLSWDWGGMAGLCVVENYQAWPLPQPGQQTDVETAASNCRPQAHA